MKSRNERKTFYIKIRKYIIWHLKNWKARHAIIKSVKKVYGTVYREKKRHSTTN